MVTMMITASSVAHLQAKNGLPLVNQALGWLVLGEFVISVVECEALMVR